jgi:hypothetical protein
VDSGSFKQESGTQETVPGPFSGTSPGIDRFADSIRSLERWYAADFERRVAGLAEVLKNQITEEMRAHFSTEMNAQVERVRTQYEERLSNQTRQWELQRETMQREIDELRRKVPTNDVLSEIAATENIVSLAMNGNHQAELTPDATSLARVFQRRVEELETKAYLRGLKFRLPENL